MRLIFAQARLSENILTTKYSRFTVVTTQYRTAEIYLDKFCQTQSYYLCVIKVPYFLEISPHLEIPPPSKSRRTWKEVGSNKRRPRNLAAWKRVFGFKVHGMQALARDSHYRNGRVRRREAGEWTSRRPRNFAAGCSDLKLNLAAAKFRGNTVFVISPM